MALSLSPPAHSQHKAPLQISTERETHWKKLCICMENNRKNRRKKRLQEEKKSCALADNIKPISPFRLGAIPIRLRRLLRITIILPLFWYPFTPLFFFPSVWFLCSLPILNWWDYASYEHSSGIDVLFKASPHPSSLSPFSLSFTEEMSLDKNILKSCYFPDC